MSNRNNILAAILANQPDAAPLPDISHFNYLYAGEDAVEKFITVSTGIGSSVHRVSDMMQVSKLIGEKFPQGRVISNLPEFAHMPLVDEVHTYADVELSIFKTRFGVAENGAMWVTEADISERVLPFICQHLVLIVNAGDILSTMHQAYERIADAEYSYATFISGPSKTADIEQSLVLGAHGPRSLTVFIIG
ncbi:MAG: LUD domain-containing protein [Mucilaginibacter sp.]